MAADAACCDNGVLLTEVEKRLARIEKSLERGAGTFQFFNDALKAHKERQLQDSVLGSRLPQKVLGRIIADTSLRFPHRKIIELLLRQFDYEKQEFQEVHFSRLVKEAHVGKGAASGYLHVLQEKGYVIRRDDGYRVFYRLNPKIEQ